MKETRNTAFNILTGKDLDYLKDIFGWNYTIYKYSENYINNIENMFNEVSKLQINSYELMYKFGWYQLEKDNKMKNTNLLNTLETEMNDLN